MTRRERILLILVGVVGVVLISYFYLYVPRKAEIQRLEAQLAELQQQRERMENTARQITRLREEYASLQAFIAEIETKLPAEKETPALLVQLERLTQSVGVGFQSIRPSSLERVSVAAAPSPGGAGAPAAGQRPAGGTAPPAGGQPPAGAAPTYLRFPIGLTVQGTYEGIVRLVTALNDFPRMIAIRNLAISPRRVPELTVNLDIETYVLPKGAR